MITRLHPMALLLLGLFAAAIPAFAQDDDQDEKPESCPGCAMTVTPPNNVNNGVPNICASSVRITLFSAHGACVLDGDDCVPERPCQVAIIVAYKSLCPTQLLFTAGPIGNPGVTWNGVSPPTLGQWVVLFQTPFVPTACGGGLRVVHVEIQDPVGYVEFEAVNFECSACDD